MLDCKATLRVKSKELSLADVVEVLGKPTDGFTKGQPFGKANRIRNHTYWSLVAGDSDDLPLQTNIMRLLDFLSDKNIDSLLEDCEIDIFCMASSDNGQGSFQLDSSVYEKLASSGLSVTFDFYSD